MDTMQLRAEQLIISCGLSEPSCIHDIMGAINTSMFQSPINKIIFEAITFLYLEQQPINTITVFTKIKESKSIHVRDAAIEVSNLTSAFDYNKKHELASSIQLLIAESIRHEHISLAETIKKKAEAEAYHPKEVLDYIQSHVSDNKYKSLQNKKEFTNEDLLNELDKRMSDALNHSGISGIKTGYERYDIVTSGLQPTNFIIIAARPAMGKELKNDSLVYTPNGPVRIGDIKVKDKVLGSDGKKYNVTGVFPQGKKDVYRIHFDDGSFVDSGLEHQWEVSTRKTRRNKTQPVVMTTAQMIDDVILSGSRKNYSIKFCKPLEFNVHNPFTMNPYLLGALLGDGHFSSSSLLFSNTEKDVIDLVSHYSTGTLRHIRDCTMSITKGQELNQIKAMGLRGARSHEKFIPKPYLYGTIKSRTLLLQGLVDTDGYVVRGNAIEYSTTSYQLCLDILELVRGLGGKANYSKKQGAYRKNGQRVVVKEYYRMYLSLPENVMPVSSKKHKAKYKKEKKYHAKFISKIEKMNYQEDMTCISVDAPDCLYVTDGYTLTHNTQYALGLMRNASIRNNYKGLFISCEMDEVQVMKRIMSVDSGIPGYHIKRGQLERNELLRFEKARQRIKNSNLKIKAGSFTISDVISMVYKLKYSEGLDYVVIDYIQKITSPGAQNRTNEVGDVSRRLKDMANELKIPVIALAQLSRAVESRTDKKPMLSDLRESGDIEQDADIVMFLYRAGYYMDVNERQSNPLADDGYAIIAKHRDGELEDIHLKFDSNIPAWQNLNDKYEHEEEYVQQAIRPNYNWDDKPF
jgi:replicative DNA helicase